MIWGIIQRVMAWKQTLKYLVGFVLLIMAVPALALAAESSSSNYQLNEVFFGSGGELNACSTTYCSKQSAGEQTVGNTKGNAYQAQAGFNTDRSPYIEFVVSNTNTNLGTLTATSTKTATSSFSVKSYLSHGYSVINASDPPTNGDYQMNSLALPTPSNPGQEQFGINLTANTNPIVYGANPVQIPSSSFGYGVVTADYSIPNSYKYTKGDIVAQSVSSSSTTNYTVSYLFNISNVTPGGTYVFRHVLVATATY